MFSGELSFANVSAKMRPANAASAAASAGVAVRTEIMVAI
jgi:hypothetical protein